MAEEKKVNTEVVADTEAARRELLELQALGREVHNDLQGVDQGAYERGPLSHPGVGATQNLTNSALIAGATTAGLNKKHTRPEPKTTVESVKDGGRSTAEKNAAHDAFTKAYKRQNPKMSELKGAGWTAHAKAVDESKFSPLQRIIAEGGKAESGGFKLGPLTLGNGIQLASLAEIVGPSFAYVAAFVGIAKASEAVNKLTRDAFDKASNNGGSFYDSLNAEFGKFAQDSIGGVAKGAGSFFIGALGDISKALHSVMAGGAGLADEFINGKSEARNRAYGNKLFINHLAIDDAVAKLIGQPTSSDKVAAYDSEKQRLLTETVNRALELGRQDAKKLSQAMWKLGFPGTKTQIESELIAIAEQVKSEQAHVAFGEQWKDQTWKQIVTGVDQGDE